MLTVLGGLAEFEQKLIKIRNGEGRERTNLQGDRYERCCLFGTSIVYWLVRCCLTVFDTVCSRRIGGQSVVG
jgi:hypothetical protein